MNTQPVLVVGHLLAVDSYMIEKASTVIDYLAYKITCYDLVDLCYELTVYML